MADNSFRVKKSLNIEPKASPTLNEQGDVGYDTADDKLKVRGSSTTDSVVTEAKSQPLTNKTIDADQNTITNIENADIKAAAGIEYSKLDLADSIVNADVATGAAIAVDKLAALTASKALQSNASGVIEASTVTNTELGYVSGVTSSIQTQLNNKQATGDYVTALTGDVTATGPGSVAATIANDAVTNAKLANMSTQTIKGRTTAGSGDPEDLSASQATAILDNMVGDSGSGGTKGLVPAPAAGDAAANKFLKADGTWATSGATITVKDENVNVDTAVTTLNFTGAGVVATQTSPGIVEVAIAGGGGGGGTGGADDNYLLDQLDQDELDIITAESVNAIRDDFGDSEKGTKTNTVQALSTLALATGQNSGSYERIRETSTVVGAARGIARLQVQALAPDNSGLSSNVFTFSGDVSSYFSAGNTKVLICKKITTDGNTAHVFLRETDDKIARLTASAVSYNSGTNKTDVTISNGGALDLDLDLTGSEYAEKLRVIPMTHDFQVKSRALSSYETADIADAHGSTTVSIPGQAAFLEAINFTGTVLHHDVRFSPNGTYAVAHIAEQVSGNVQWRYYGSSNKGVTWTLLGSKAYNSTSNEQFNFVWSLAHKEQTIVADNGKWFGCYAYYNGSNHDVKGVYGDLTLSNFLDSAAQSGGNPGGALGTIGSGNVSVTGSEDYCWAVAGDQTDLSMVAAYIQQNGADYHTIVYSNGGAAHFATKITTMSGGGLEKGHAIMTGSSGSRRLWLTAYYTAGPTANIGYLSESENFQTLRNAVGSAGATNIANANLPDVALHNNKLIIISSASNVNYYYYIDNATTGTPTGLSTQKQICPFGINNDYYLGAPSSTSANFVRHANNRIYLNNDRLVYATDYYHADGVRRTHVNEIRDITSYQGAHINQNSANYNQQFRHATTTTKICQTFLASTSRVRTIALAALQLGTIPTGHTITCEIQTLTNPASSTSAPTGTVVSTAIATLDPRSITKNSSQMVFFSFDSPALTNGNYYAIVLSGTATISGTNYIAFTASNANPYANGSIGLYNGSVWDMASVAAGDLRFQVYGDWIYDLSHETRSESQEYGKQIWNQEATLAAVDSSTLRMAHRRALNDLDVQRAKSGHVWSSLITLGSSGAASTYTTPAQIGRQSNAYDKNLVFSVIPGVNASGRVDRTTGVVTADSLAEVRGGLRDMSVSSYSNITSADYVAEANFQSGIGLDLDGSSEYVTYDNAQSHQLNSAYPFCVEAEFIVSTLSGTRTIVSTYNDTVTTGGWALSINDNGVAGNIAFNIVNNASTSINRSASGTIAINTRYCARATYAGDGSAPRIFLSTTGWDGTFNEVSYVGGTQAPFTFSTNTTGPLKIGAAQSNNSYVNFFSGKIGYVKFAQGSSTFAYAGAKDQRAMVGLVNTGTKVFAETKGGNMSNADMNQTYDEFGMIDPNGSSNAIVDSNDIYLMFDHTIAGTKGQVNYLKVNMARASGTDVGAIKGLNFKFSK
jgi:hypothetical protein